MVVAQFIDSLEIGGAEQVAVNFANSLSKFQHIKSIIIIGRSNGPLLHKLNDKVQVVQLNKQSKVDFAAIKKLKTLIKREQIDIIHAHSSSFLYPAILKPFIKCKLIWHDHYGRTIKPNGKREYPYIPFSRFFDFAFCVSLPLYENAIAHLKLHQDRIKYLPNYSVAIPVSASEKLIKPLDFKVLVLCANVRPQKDHANIIRAMAKVKLTMPNIKLYCIGGGNSGAYFDSLIKLVESLNLQNNISFEGSQNNPFKYLDIADLAVLSSESEGLPLSLIEYGLAKKPVVCTNVGQCNMLIQAHTGWLVEPKNHELLADNIIEALNNSIMSEQKAQQLYQIVSETYAESAVIGQTLEVYNWLINN